MNYANLQHPSNFFQNLSKEIFKILQKKIQKLKKKPKFFKIKIKNIKKISKSLKKN
jgi:hypothetical protein